MVRTCVNTSAAIQASPGPWRAEPSLFGHGAAYIEDADGEIIGWATDAAGHTTEETPPDRRSPQQTMLNAYMMALAPQAIAALLVFLEASPGVVARLRGAALPCADLGYAHYEGEKVLAQLRAARIHAEMRGGI